MEDDDFGDYDDEPIGSCEECGCNLYEDDWCDEGLCDQCYWFIYKANE